MNDTTNTPEGATPDIATPDSGAATSPATPDSATPGQPTAIDTDELGAADALELAEAKAAEHLEDLQRLQAEYVNYRKRVDRDRALITDNAQAAFVEALLPVMDDIAAARQHGDLVDGPFASIADKLDETLGRFGWSTYGAPGDEFDPTVHEALMSQPSADVTGPTVTDVVQLGHRIGERIVRPARVIVAQPEE